MLIHDMTRQASLELLSRSRLCRLACARDGQPYITPISCAYDDNYIYSFTTLGQKIRWMRANPLVCVEADEIVTLQNWASVVVMGRYEELPDAPESDALRKHAYDLLQRRPVWWEPGYVKTTLDEKTRPIEAVYFRIHISEISGHHGILDPASERKLLATHPPSMGWIQKILGFRAMKRDD